MQGEVVEGQRRGAGARGSQDLGKQGERGRLASFSQMEDIAISIRTGSLK